MQRQLKYRELQEFLGKIEVPLGTEQVLPPFFLHANSLNIDPLIWITVWWNTSVAPNVSFVGVHVVLREPYVQKFVVSTGSPGRLVSSHEHRVNMMLQFFHPAGNKMHKFPHHLTVCPLKPLHSIIQAFNFFLFAEREENKLYIVKCSLAAICTVCCTPPLFFPNLVTSKFIKFHISCLVKWMHVWKTAHYICSSILELLLFVHTLWLLIPLFFLDVIFVLLLFNVVNFSVKSFSSSLSFYLFRLCKGL